MHADPSNRHHIKTEVADGSGAGAPSMAPPTITRGNPCGDPGCGPLS